MINRRAWRLRLGPPSSDQDRSYQLADPCGLTLWPRRALLRSRWRAWAGCVDSAAVHGLFNHADGQLLGCPYGGQPIAGLLTVLRHRLARVIG
jgi:hypothetical protein